MAGIIILICLIFAILLALILINKQKFKFYGNGYDIFKPGHKIGARNIVIDTLNMTYEMNRKPKYRIQHDDILNTIRIVTEKLKPIVSDKIIFITKTNEQLGEHDYELESYEKISKELKVYIYIVNKLKEPNKNTFVRIKKSHSTLGRDDFYIMVTAWKLRCPVLGQDYYRDLRNMKFGELDSFYVIKYSPYKKFPIKDYINPTGHEYRRMRAPRVIRWNTL